MGGGAHQGMLGQAQMQAMGHPAMMVRGPMSNGAPPQPDPMLSRLNTEQRLVNDVQLMVEQFLTNMRTTLGWEVCQLWVPTFQQTVMLCLRCSWDPRAELLSMFAQEVLKMGIEITPGSASLPARVWQARSPEFVEDLRVNREQSMLHHHAEAAGLKSAMAFPVIVDEKIIAVICAMCSGEQRGHLQESSIAFMSSFALSFGYALVVTFSRLCNKTDEQTKQVLPIMLHHTNSVWRNMQNPGF